MAEIIAGLIALAIVGALSLALGVLEGGHD
jgi:Flp pilus assembly pilin Flp